MKMQTTTTAPAPRRVQDRTSDELLAELQAPAAPTRTHETAPISPDAWAGLATTATTPAGPTPAPALLYPEHSFGWPHSDASPAARAILEAAGIAPQPTPELPEWFVDGRGSVRTTFTAHLSGQQMQLVARFGRHGANLWCLSGGGLLREDSVTYTPGAINETTLHYVWRRMVQSTVLVAAGQFTPLQRATYLDLPRPARRIVAASMAQDLNARPAFYPPTHPTLTGQGLTPLRTRLPSSPHVPTYRTRGGLITRKHLGQLVAGVIRSLRRDTVTGYADREEVMGDLQQVRYKVECHPLIFGSRYSGLLAALRREAEASPWWSDHYDDAPLVRAHCGHFVTPDCAAHHDNHGRYWCESCSEDYLAYPADDDSELRHRDELYLHDDGELYTYEQEDEDDEDEDEDSPLLDCWSASTYHLAHDGTFTPSALGDFTLGVELEVEASRGSYRGAALSDCDEHFNSGRFGRASYAMFKRDGSLSDERGFEIVTAARRLGDHLQVFKDWKPHGELTAWDAGCCGMHVHIDSRAFSALTLGKFLMFINDEGNAEFIRSIAGRHPSRDDTAESYASAITDTASPVDAKADSCNRSRYRMVNLTNLGHAEQDRLGVDVERCSKGDYSTVELRIFRATLRKARLLAQLEFAHASVMFCRTASWSDLTGRAFKAWLRRDALGYYPHLARWFGAGPARNKNAPRAAGLESASCEV